MARGTDSPSTVPQSSARYQCFFTDLHSREKDAGEESVVYKTIKIGRAHV